MITTLNTNNSNDYRALFQSAYNFLKDNVSHLSADRQPSINAMTSITSVQQYFSHLKDLLDLEAYGGRRYLMLPLDEPYFEVDANKREIAIPAEFKKNGISVQGDEIAESLIFKINRFFDYADLNEMTVQVQWENANKEQGVSDAFVVDAVKNADFLYVMWPLTESVTRYAGTVKFSLRFYKKNGNTLDYSFSTKIAAATINSGHDFEVENWANGFDNASGRFTGAIVNSKNTAAEDAMAPYYLINLDNTPDGSQVENADYNDGTVIEAYIDPANPTQLLRVSATSNDAGNISYRWQYQDTLNTDYVGGLTYNLEGVDEYVRSEDTEKNEHKVYYKQVGSDDNITYEPIEFQLQDGLTLYERTNTYVVAAGKSGKNTVTSETEVMPHVVGLYKAIARNTVGDNYEETDSLSISFPAPEHLAFLETGNLVPNSYLNTNGEGSLEVEVEIDERGAASSFEWEFGETLTGPFVLITDASIPAAEQAKLAPSQNGDKGILTINGKPGFYRVKAISTRNYSPISLYSDVTKVTMPLQAPAITAPLYDTAVSSLYGDATLTVQVTVLTDTLLSEGITYQWYTDQNEAVENAGGNVPSTGTITLTVPQGTRMGYYCIVTNHMGEDTVDSRSADFSVNPINPETGNGNTEG